MKTYKNEQLFVESIINNYDNIKNIQHSIKEKFNTNSTFDKENGILYIWNESNDNIDIAKEYILENIDINLIDIDCYKPKTIYENENVVYVIYFEDGIIYDIYNTKDDAEKELEILKKENKKILNPTIKPEPISNFIELI